MKLAFSENFANFGNLCQTENINVNKIIHKTYIDLNENGTEATAVTSVEMTYASMPKEEYFMYVNHSFIYMIQSDKIQDIENEYLMPFIGIVNKLEERNSEEKENEEKTDIKKENEENEEPEKIIIGNYQNKLKFKFGLIIYLITLLYS